MLFILFLTGYMLTFGHSMYRPCIPNTQLRMNGRLCFCDGLGRWSEANCETRQTCRPGQIIWEDCSQCICQESGHFLCTTICADAPKILRKQLEVQSWCMPFVSYYVNCSLCVCPASGKITEARCARDASCPFRGVDYKIAIRHNICIPKVMYLFECLQCQCSDDGFFVSSKCVDTCKPNVAPRRCTPKRFYRKDCNICWCPENSVVNEALCTKSQCKDFVRLVPLNALRNLSQSCHRHAFTSPKCYYCECTSDGHINENACLESDCVNLKYDLSKNKCSPNEMVPICFECFCLKNGQIDLKFCTKACSNQEKIMILELIMKESLYNNRLIDKGAINRIKSNAICQPNTIYLDEGKFCLCPENGDTNLKLCSNNHDTEAQKKQDRSRHANTEIDFEKPCDPSTFVEFDCNTCYCLKSGKLDPKWCTYDDCEAKRLVQESLKTQVTDPNSANGVCVPGSISKVDCNFCICNDNGLIKDRACTKNVCADLDRPNNNIEKFTCEPLVYYTVDCNTCFCSSNGLKNIAKCTKNVCEKNFLRSEVCVPGDLFSEECNVCVCPPNGDKNDKVCSNFTCSDTDAPWKKIFKLSQSLMSNQVMEETTRSLELCFPGEEFEVGCKICVCPDMGLREFATCTQMLCDDYNNTVTTVPEQTTASNNHSERVKRDVDKSCIHYNLSETSYEKYQCTPGSMYIVRCKQCICPYMGDIHYFCRPLPKTFYCEQPYPGVNYLAKFSRRSKANKTESSMEIIQDSSGITILHEHTEYTCDVQGRISDKCFICECENNIIIEEHCFKSNATDCENARPTFLNENRLILV